MFSPSFTILYRITRQNHILNILQNLTVVGFKVGYRFYNEVTGDIICPNMVRGIDHLRNPRLNKGLAFTLEERQALGIQGLLAPEYKTRDEQLNICRISIDRYKDNLNKYLYLAELQDTNEKLFFSLLAQNIEKYMPIVYTPTVGLACQKFGLAYRRAPGLFVTIHDKGNIVKILSNWPEHDVQAIVFTDGERILGLGDLGAYGMGIPVGKLALYTALAGVRPHKCLPITLDVGTDNQDLLQDPLYIGLRQKRVRGREYDEFIDEFMQACTVRFGHNVLLQFEDFALANATRLLEKYKDEYCTFNDDIQGTAGVAVAGLFAALRISKIKLVENTIMFLGAGSAATGIANLTVAAMMDEGLDRKQAMARMYLFDIDGLLTIKRKAGIPEHAQEFAKDLPPQKNFEQCVAELKPTVLIGCSTVRGAFTTNILKQMAKNAERPVIFALSNPTSKAECTPQEAYDNTKGKCIYASGSPFPPVKYGGKEYKTGQGNNSYIFPGIALGVITSRAHVIPNFIFLTAARKLANFVSEKDLAIGRIYPPLSDVRKVSFEIAMDVAELCYSKDIATAYPQPKNLRAYMEERLYKLEYPQYLPNFFKYPKPPNIKLKSIDDIYSESVPGINVPPNHP